MNIKPIGRRILLKITKEEKTKSGLYIPESAKDKKEGIVIELGTSNDKPFPVKVGDKVLYGGYSSEEFEFGNEMYLIISVKDILAKMEEK